MNIAAAIVAAKKTYEALKSGKIVKKPKVKKLKSKKTKKRPLAIVVDPLDLKE